MGNRLSKIYTRTGDAGTTGLGDGERVAKDDVRVEAYGTVDELNSAIGVVLSHPDLPQGVQKCLMQIQQELFDLGGELCMPGHRAIFAADIERLEATLDAFNEALPPLKDFILPGGGAAAAACHLARTICRRAERRTWTLARARSGTPVQPQSPEAPLQTSFQNVAPEVMQYLNRLSDLLFVLARVLARHAQGSEVLWNARRDRPA